MRTGKLRLKNSTAPTDHWFKDFPVRQSDDGPVEYQVGYSPLSLDGWAPLPEHNFPNVKWDDEARARLEATVLRGINVADPNGSLSEFGRSLLVRHIADALEQAEKAS